MSIDFFKKYVIIWSNRRKDLTIMKPEEEARKKIDELLGESGWRLQDPRELNLGASLGVAIREFPLKTQTTDDST